jgi:hypothetical protein
MRDNENMMINVLGYFCIIISRLQFPGVASGCNNLCCSEIRRRGISVLEEIYYSSFAQVTGLRFVAYAFTKRPDTNIPEIAWAERNGRAWHAGIPRFN